MTITEDILKGIKVNDFLGCRYQSYAIIASSKERFRTQSPGKYDRDKHCLEIESHNLCCMETPLKVCFTFRKRFRIGISRKLAETHWKLVS